ncbi:rRNA methyltransferase 3, mitochondrial [Pectinophora gossypiella]|uniref:rRNA methyltransferase 3, mitochondrial n=1 Tax=Pectinophora gossypiella TaxID=13191 RepID=UPI00214F1762|nr:rRNA methyltransferase 3, mitochondrial [Pectinophora gossypiella]
MSLKGCNRLLLQTLLNSRPVLNSGRTYGRWSHRKPAKVLLPFEPPSKVGLKKENVIDLDAEVLNKPQDSQAAPKGLKQTIIEEEKVSDITPEKAKDIKAKREDKLKKRKFYLSQLKVFDDNNEIIYEKCKDNDGRISNLLTNLKSKKDRIRTKQVMVEGWRLIVDGLEAKCSLKYVIFSRTDELNNLRPFLPRTGVKFFKVPYKEIELWSDVETPSGIFGVFEMPTQEKIKRLSKPLPLDLICDNIRIPGNLGAILRAAVGAGCDKVLLTKGCVDVWDPKVIRSAAGAHFRLPVNYSIDWEEMPRHLEENTSIFIADSNAQMDDETGDQFDSTQIPVLPYYSVQYPSLNHITLIVGGETEGISEESYRLAASKNGMRLNIPMAKGVDSLNTGMATAIIAFEIRKQLIQAWTKIKLDRQIAQAT